MPWLLSLFGVKKNADSLLAQYCFGDLVDTAPQVLKSPDCYFLSLLGLSHLGTFLLTPPSLHLLSFSDFGSASLAT